MFCEQLEAVYHRDHSYQQTYTADYLGTVQRKGFYHNNGLRKIGVRITSRINSASSSFTPVVQRRTVTCLPGVKKVKDFPKMSFASMNCRSVYYKASLISDEVVQNNFDCVTHTETWLNHEDDDYKAVISSLVPSEYHMVLVTRAARG